jgi:hypothetical protein
MQICKYRNPNRALQYLECTTYRKLEYPVDKVATNRLATLLLSIVRYDILDKALKSQEVQSRVSAKL